MFQGFCCVGSALLHPISIKKQSQIDAKINDDIDCLLDRFLDAFLMDFQANLASKIDATSTKHLKINSKRSYDFGWIFGGPWVGLGSQVGSKINFKIDHRPTCKLDRSFYNFMALGSHVEHARRGVASYSTSMHPSKEHSSGGF